MSEDKLKDGKIEYDSPEIDEETRQVIQEIKAKFGGSGIVEEKDMYYTILQLYKTDPDLLPVISDLDKEHIENLTKIDTWIKSAIVLFDLEDEDKNLQILETMRNSYLKYSISRNRKSRNEMKDIFSSVQQSVRTISDKIMGRRP